jgi:glycosyltransferase involved in cell wall biosynthesis
MEHAKLNPYISVILPVYNAEKFIYEAVCSVLEQTYTNFELLIINDGSSDGTADILNELAVKDSRIKLFHHENQGIIKALNFGLNQSKGQYIARMDADDISYPKRFEKQIKFLHKHPDIVLCGTQVKYIGCRHGFSDMPCNVEDSKAQLLFSTPVFHPTVMFRNVPLEYNMNYLHSEDYKYWSDISSFGSVSNINEVLLEYRVHYNQISKLKNIDQLSQQLRISHENLKKLHYSEKDGACIDDRQYCTILMELISNKKLRGNPNRIGMCLYYNLAFFGLRGSLIYFKFSIKNHNFNLIKVITFMLRTLKWSRFKYD